VIHLRARTLLHRLPDDTLPPEVEIELRAHVASCARCRRRLHEIQISEDLLRRLPPSIVPLEAGGRDAYVRLAALARWTDDEEIAANPEGWRLSFLSVASVVLIFCLAASAGSWAPTIRPGMGPTVNLETLPPDHTYLTQNYR
jgi:anti-sigma factor RsiW